MNEMVAYCGLYCGACSFKIAFEENNREHILAMPDAFDHLKSMPLEFCPGCRVENQCGECSIRDCAIDRKVEYCSLCNDFPCNKITNFSNDGKPHHTEVIENLRLLKEIGEEKWLGLQKKKWTCKHNTRHSWYYRACKKCIAISNQTTAVSEK